MIVTKVQLIAWLQLCAAVLNENRAYLTELDSAIGDADHGTNIARGFGIVAAQAAQHDAKDIGALLKATGMTLMSKVGGASGILYGNFFMKAAMSASGKEALNAHELLTLLEDGLAGIVQRGRAQVGDKTMIDAWTPALQAMQNALDHAGDPDGDHDGDLALALQRCAAAAEDGMKATIPLQAKKGRASYLGERSIGHQDPGATSTQMILQALADTVTS